MSIIYNNQVVAGKYTQQVVADADTVNAGIIKIATEEQINEGTDNTTAVTPFYLAQKQDKISAGDGIVIDNNEISCTVNPDEQTIVRKNNGTMQCIGQLTKSNTLKFEWEGTQAEYNIAYLNGTIQPDWYCYITDDEEFVDYGDIANQSLSNLKAEGEARFTAKANTDLDNLSSVGQDKLDAKADKATTLNGYGITDGLNKNQITNCLLEVPQNIKLELTDGVLTLKAGSKVIVPNGFEANGTTPKFDEVTIANNISKSSNINPHSIMFYDTSSNVFNHFNIDVVFSGDTAPTTFISNYAFWYDTANNVIKRTANGGATWVSGMSLPVCIVSGINESSNSAIGSIDQVFNGMGYIGSTIWVDKGVKGLIPNGRNEDGSLRNKELLTDKVLTATATQPYWMILNTNGALRLHAVQNTTPYINSSWWYDEQANIFYTQGSSGIIYNEVLFFATVEGSSSTGITSFRPKLPFRAVDYNDKSIISGWSMPSNRYIDLTLGASGTEYTAPANGYFLIIYNMTGNSWCNCFNNSSFIGIYNTYSTATAEGARAWCPVKKDDICKIYYQNIGNANLKFIYAEGEQ